MCKLYRETTGLSVAASPRYPTLHGFGRINRGKRAGAGLAFRQEAPGGQMRQRTLLHPSRTNQSERAGCVPGRRRLRCCCSESVTGQALKGPAPGLELAFMKEASFPRRTSKRQRTLLVPEAHQSRRLAKNLKRRTAGCVRGGCPTASAGLDRRYRRVVRLASVAPSQPERKAIIIMRRGEELLHAGSTRRASERQRRTFLLHLLGTASGRFEWEA